MYRVRVKFCYKRLNLYFGDYANYSLEYFSTFYQVWVDNRKYLEDISVFFITRLAFEFIDGFSQLLKRKLVPLLDEAALEDAQIFRCKRAEFEL